MLLPPGYLGLRDDYFVGCIQMRFLTLLRGLLVLAVIAALLGPSPVPAQAVTSIRLRIGVIADNLYRITPADLPADERR